MSFKISTNKLYIKEYSHLFTEVMITKKKCFELLNVLYFVLDNVMFWEAFRWERLDTGYIYIQKFPNGKMYAGQTITLARRCTDYRNLKGNNPHHTNALKKYGWDNVKVAFALCPKYLLDTVEIFVIDFFNLINVTKGYNKRTGGRKGYRVSKETCMRISIAISGEKHRLFGKSHTEETRKKMSEKQSGENHPMFGKRITEKTRAKLSGINNHNYGKTFSEQTLAKLSGGNSPNSKPLCAFGKLYDAASTASNTLCEVCNTKTKGNFMRYWIHKKNIQRVYFTFPKSFTKL
ncbi:GIY-YIG catalytic domain-containing endonuclease [Acanthocystis turfacea Chlorella virus NE-JV-2]|nr:GIY-YIG catalytic domain-containing endonuclease [Acanthocystis turfacea Chlorella virus NE-JV-2]